MARPVAGATTEYTLLWGMGGGYGKISSRGDPSENFEVEGILVSIGFDKTRDRANLRVESTVFKKDANIVANRATYNINFIFSPECSDLPEIWINSIHTLLRGEEFVYSKWEVRL
jgi:hypothetical protein